MFVCLSQIEPSSRDWIGIFPRGWCNLQQYINFEWVSQSYPVENPNPDQNNKENGDLVKRIVHFCPKYLATVSKNSFYQFVYISKQIEVRLNLRLLVAMLHVHTRTRTNLTKIFVFRYWEWAVIFVSTCNIPIVVLWNWNVWFPRRNYDPRPCRILEYS